MLQARSGAGDDEFVADDESSTDDEATLEREEEMEEDEGSAVAASKTEINDLEAEGELPLEELVKKYAGAYHPDFEQNLPSDDSSGDEESSDDNDKESTASSDAEIDVVSGADSSSSEGKVQHWFAVDVLTVLLKTHVELCDVLRASCQRIN